MARPSPTLWRAATMPSSSSTITGRHPHTLYRRCVCRIFSMVGCFSLSLQLGPLCEREGAHHRLPCGEHGSVVPHWGVLAELGRGLENLHQRKALRWRQRPVSRHHYPRCSAIFNLFCLFQHFSAKKKEVRFSWIKLWLCLSQGAGLWY